MRLDQPTKLGHFAAALWSQNGLQKATRPPARNGLILTVARLWSMEIIVEIYRNPGEPSSRPVRVRPLPCQPYSENCHVWCSSGQRRANPQGSLFRVHVSLVHQPKKGSYLRIGINSPWTPVTSEEAKRFIGRNLG